MQYWGMTLRPKPKKLIFNSNKKTKQKTMNGRNRSTVSHFSDTGSLKASSKEHIFRLPEHVRTTDTHWVHVGTLSKDHNVNAINLDRDRNDNLLKKP